MQKKILVAAAVLAALTLAACLSLLVPGLVKLMETHQGVSSWAQAAFSVIAIMASALLSLIVPAELRRLEKQDLCLRALSLAVISLEHGGKMLATTWTRMQEHGLHIELAAIARLELEVRLDEMSRIPVEALPEQLLHDLFNARAQIRVYCIAFGDVESGKLKPEQLSIENLEAAIDLVSKVENRCRTALRSLGVHAQKRGLLGSGKMYGSGVVGVIGTEPPSPVQRKLAPRAYSSSPPSAGPYSKVSRSPG